MTQIIQLSINQQYKNTTFTIRGASMQNKF